MIFLPAALVVTLITHQYILVIRPIASLWVEATMNVLEGGEFLRRPATRIALGIVGLEWALLPEAHVQHKAHAVGASAALSPPENFLALSGLGRRHVVRRCRWVD